MYITRRQYYLLKNQLFLDAASRVAACKTALYILSSSLNISIACDCVGNSVSCIFRSNTTTSNFRFFNSSSFFYFPPTTSRSVGKSFSNLVFSVLYCSISFGMLSKGLRKFVATLWSDITIRSRQSNTTITRLRRVIIPFGARLRRVTRCLLSYSKDTLLSSGELKNPPNVGLKISFIINGHSILTLYTVPIYFIEWW